jgi:magnesium transporter
MKNAPKDNILKIMQTETHAYDAQRSVDSVVKELNNSTSSMKGVYDIFVFQQEIIEGKNQNIFMGFVSFLDLFRCKTPHATFLSSLVKAAVTIPWTFSQEDAAIIFHKHDLICAPIVNDKKVMLGLVTVDDILDVIQECADQDMLALAGVHNADLYAPIIEIAYQRLRWLCVTLCTCLLSIYVMFLFQSILEKNVVLAIVCPITGVLAGATGSQVTTVTILNLNNRVLNRSNIGSMFWRELRVTLFNASCLSLIILTLMMLFMGDRTLGLFLACATFFNMIWAVTVGFFLPIVLEYYHFDPAICANLVVNASADIVGTTIFLLFAGSTYVYVVEKNASDVFFIF